MAKEETLSDVVGAVMDLAGLLGAVEEAVRHNTEAVESWGAEIEDRLGKIEANTRP